jgi:peptidoglycan/LPS O-acetylase OafA/YrhL
MQRNRDYDTLRGFAVSATFFSHVDELMQYPGRLVGFFAFPWGLGVDIFFVLSGMLITQSLIGAMEKHSSGGVLKEFWIKRLFRILPASLAWLAISTFVAYWFLPHEQSGVPGILRSSAASLLNVQNFWFSYCVQTHQVATYCGGLKTLAVWWSLSLEEQFYVVFPVVLLLLRFRMTVLAATAAMLFCAFQHKAFLNLALAFRLEGLCYGVLLALAYETAKRWKSEVGFRIHDLALKVMGYAALSSVFLIPNYLLSTGYGRTVFAATMLMCFLTVAVASRDRDSFDLGFVSKAVHWIGTVSYSFYLCHEAVLATLAYVFNRYVGRMPYGLNFFIYAAIAFSASLVLAWVTHIYIEKPFIALGREILHGKPRTTQPVAATA